MENSPTTPFQLKNKNNKILICGLPHKFIEITLDSLRNSIIKNYGNCDIINVNDITEETLLKIEETRGPVIFWADCPSQHLVDLAREASFPIVILDIDFASATKAFMRLHNTDLMGTLRSMALAKIGIWEMMNIPRATIFPSTDQSAINIFNEFGFDVKETIFNNPHHDSAEISHLDHEIISEFQELYGKNTIEETHSFNIPMSFLYNGTPPYNPLHGTIDLCGPARIISFGPYLYLPKGKWEASFYFDSTDNDSENNFRIDVASNETILHETEFQVRSDGKFKYNFHFKIENSWNAFEFRTHLGKGAISGHFSPVKLTLIRDISNNADWRNAIKGP